jgi:two-component system, sensor histidine kinase and response regulator
VIFLSAADDKDFILRAFDAGGVDYITKPFNNAELISRVRTQLALKTARDNLKQLAEDREELTGILAHDLKNHLGGMEMSAKLLYDHLKVSADPRAVRLAENIVHSGSQLLAFVKEFLANAATDHGMKLLMDRHDLAQAARVAVRQYGEAANRKQQQIIATIPDDEVWVQADHSALRQVLENLLSNALKFSPAASKVTVTVGVDGDFAECEIRDEGPGFTREDQARMFQRYGRLSARPTGGEPSSGLGLSIVQKLVREMKGELLCVSEPDKGAAFKVRLPKATVVDS